MAKTNVEIIKKENENILSLVRRFQKRVQESGVLSRVRGIRYNQREQSDLKTKRAKLRKIEKTIEYERLIRLGKVVERKRGRR